MFNPPPPPPELKPSAAAAVEANHWLINHLLLNTANNSELISANLIWRAFRGIKTHRPIKIYFPVKKYKTRRLPEISEREKKKIKKNRENIQNNNNDVGDKNDSGRDFN